MPDFTIPIVGMRSLDNVDSSHSAMDSLSKNKLSDHSQLSSVAGENAQFSDLVAKNLDNLSTKIQKAQQLSQSAILGDSHVDIHSVVLAMQQATDSLKLVKIVVDKSIQAYDNLINMR